VAFSKWDHRMIGLSQLVSSWSKDPSTQVGAAIVDAKNRVVALGFNGLPRTVADDAAILANRDERLRRTIHAEENALLFATRSVENCTIYVTHPPCARCAAKLIQAGVMRVVSAKPLSAFSERWGDDVRSSTSMFAEAGVSFEILEPVTGDKEPSS
jgi:dCMP deaminase